MFSQGHCRSQCACCRCQWHPSQSQNQNNRYSNAQGVCVCVCSLCMFHLTSAAFENVVHNDATHPVLRLCSWEQPLRRHLPPPSHRLCWNCRCWDNCATALRSAWADISGVSLMATSRAQPQRHRGHRDKQPHYRRPEYRKQRGVIRPIPPFLLRPSCMRMWVGSFHRH
jgi:hypothetical protein